MIILTPDADGIAKAAEHLRSGGIVAHPTETCYGFACDLRSAAAVTRLFALKQRPADKPVSGLFPSVEQAAAVVAWSDQAQALADAHLPGPLTIILPLREGVHLLPQPTGGATLGVRISSHPVAMALAQATGFPVSTTSANLHGLPNPYSTTAILDQFGAEALRDVLLLDGGALPGAPPSTVIDLATGAVLRSGTVATEPHALPPL